MNQRENVPHIFLLDNFDSFSFNLAYEFEVKGCSVEVWRNSISAEFALEQIEIKKKPVMVVLSPGPGAPRDAGCTIDLIKKSKGAFPIFGVCLGHQAIVEAFGGVVGSANMIVHGKTSEILHNGKTIFEGLQSPMPIARYHSLVAAQMPDELRATAYSGELVMALEHRTWPIIGVQFHPESILTPHGSQLIDNVINWAMARGTQ